MAIDSYNNYIYFTLTLLSPAEQIHQREIHELVSIRIINAVVKASDQFSPIEQGDNGASNCHVVSKSRYGQSLSVHLHRCNISRALGSRANMSRMGMDQIH